VKERAWFYPASAALALGLAIGGFSITYLSPMLEGASRPPLLVHLHAAAFSSWLLLFLVQSCLVEAGRVRLHRTLGVAGVLLVPLMIASGCQVALTSTAGFVADGAGDAARAFLLVPLTDLVIFAGLVAFGLAYRRRPQIHRRLMLLATAALLPPAIARAFIPLGVMSTWPSTFAADLFLVAAIGRDLWLDRRVHPAHRWAAAWILAVHILRELSADSAVWLSIARRLIG
jgi:cytochrome bd-type quinol oxidase subunit 2